MNSKLEGTGGKMHERHVCVWLLISALGLALLLVEPARAQNFGSALGSAADEIAGAVEHAGKKRVAVIDFDQIEGHVTALGRFLAEEISDDLAERPRPFAVIDRANLQSILEEHALSMSGLVNPENAKKLGQIAGVDALVLGTYTDFGESYRLSLKAIATDTAEVVASARANVPKTNALVRLADELVGERKLTAKTPAEAEPGRQASATPIGCYADRGADAGTAGRDLHGVFAQLGDMTVEECITSCASKGFKYAGTQYGSQCFCGMTYGKYGKSNACSMPCAGNPDEICGGFWANSVYSTHAQEQGEGVVHPESR